MVNPDNWQKSMYDHRFVDWTINSPLMRMVAIKEVEGLIRLLRLKPGDRILDVPCGTGRHSGALASRGFDVVGVDFNPSLLKIARRARDDLGMYICTGVFFFMFIHIIVNVGMNMGILPVTGIPLPFLSAGGSGLIVVLLAMGVAQNVAVQARVLRF
jgi:SAM-dependent methyltransferase